MGTFGIRALTLSALMVAVAVTELIDLWEHIEAIFRGIDGDAILIVLVTVVLLTIKTSR